MAAIVSTLTRVVAAARSVGAGPSDRRAADRRPGGRSRPRRRLHPRRRVRRACDHARARARTHAGGCMDRAVRSILTATRTAPAPTADGARPQPRLGAPSASARRASGENLILRIRPRLTDLVPPAPGRRLGVRSEHRRRTALRAADRPAPLPPSVGGRRRDALAEPPPAGLRRLHRRAACAGRSRRGRCAATWTRSWRSRPLLTVLPALDRPVPALELEHQPAQDVVRARAGRTGRGPRRRAPPSAACAPTDGLPCAGRPAFVSSTWIARRSSGVAHPLDEPASSSRSSRFVIAPVDRLACRASWPGERRYGGPTRFSIPSTLHSPRVSPWSARVSLHRPLQVRAEELDALDDPLDLEVDARQLGRELLEESSM